ncbi:toxin-activating lysine-acyltransferase [Tateyamaria omphalii]|uniref:RTX toxin-activating lysine-acyltransferase n=1 Tax=Tateyamaria omphalii TaxID=299262 RepID=A0A1P8MTE6_9RHOB|nr:toxin-activating lysine-acyltransferase [Tateyamaria omphalii]APX11356.1 hypothetical protein BWR18_06435 [Tateyamaria omphalii]
MVTTDVYRAIGVAERLLAQSDYHRVLPLASYMEVEIIPPVMAGQFKIYNDEDGMPEGMVTWAWINETVEAGLHQTGRSLRADEWQSGDRLFFNDWLSPETGMRRMLRDMTTHRFPDHVASAIRHNPDGTVRKINRFIGRNVPRTRRRAPVRNAAKTAPRPQPRAAPPKPNIVAHALAQHLCDRAGPHRTTPCRLRLAVEGAAPLDLVWAQALTIAHDAGTSQAVLSLPAPTALHLAQSKDGVDAWSLDSLCATCDIAGDRGLGLRLLDTLSAPDAQAARVFAAQHSNTSPPPDPIILPGAPHQTHILHALAAGRTIIQGTPTTAPEILTRLWPDALGDTRIRVPGAASITTLGAACAALRCGTDPTMLSFGLPGRLARAHPMPVFDLSRALSPRVVLARDGTVHGPQKRARHSLIHVLTGAVDLSLAAPGTPSTAPIQSGGQALNTPLPTPGHAGARVTAGQTALIPAGTYAQATLHHGPVALITTDLHKL